MKSALLSTLFFTLLVVSAQKNDLQLEEIVHWEKITATKKWMFWGNPNTQNYDITYYKLEFTVNTASSWDITSLSNGFIS